jgi:hypothetical protein
LRIYILLPRDDTLETFACFIFHYHLFGHM